MFTCGTLTYVLKLQWLVKTYTPNQIPGYAPVPPSWNWYDVIADQPRFVFDGPKIILKLHVDRIYTLQNIAIFIFGPFGLKSTIYAPFGEFMGILPLNEFWYCCNPKRAVLWRKRVVWAINRENPSTRAMIRSGCVLEKNQYNQQKSHKTVTFHLSEEKPPTERIEMKFVLAQISET